jgi:hypothetical protein
MPEAEAAKPAPSAALLTRWRDKLVDAAVLTIPTALITQSIGLIQNKLFAEPWQILWVAVPLAALVFAAWKLLRPPTAHRVDTRFAIFLVAYASLFGLLSASDLLVWKRTPLFADDGGRAWLMPVAAGDWRYWLVREAVRPTRLYVVLHDHHDNMAPVEKRTVDAQIIEAAIVGGAKGVFFDIAYTRLPGTEDVLCGAVASAGEAKIPVITSYRLVPQTLTGLYMPEPDPEHSPECLGENPDRHVYRAHAMVFADVDGRVRTVPTTWQDVAPRSALSVRIAQCMTESGCDGNDLELPPGALLRFLPGTAQLRMAKGDQAVRELISNPSQLQDQFLLVGERSTSDRFRTPGKDATGGKDKATGEAMTAGVVIHAYAANSLFSKRYFRRPPAWFSGFMVIAVCGILALLALQGAGLRRLLIVAGIESLAVVAVAAFAAKFLLVWLDVIYALIALWLLVPLLLAYFRLGARFTAKNR